MSVVAEGSGRFACEIRERGFCDGGRGRCCGGEVVVVCYGRMAALGVFFLGQSD